MALESVQHPPESRSGEPADVEQIDILFNEMDAVVWCMQEQMRDRTDKRGRDVAYALSMVLERLIKELGRSAGVIA